LDVEYLLESDAGLVSDAIKHKNLNALYRLFINPASEIPTLTNRVKQAVNTALDKHSGFFNGLKIISNTLFHATALTGDDELMQTIVKTIKMQEASIRMSSCFQYTFEIGGELRPRWLNCVQLAAMLGHTALIELFHEVDAKCGDEHRQIEQFQTEKKGRKFDDKETCELTPLMLAARNGHSSTVKRLIELRFQYNESEFSVNYRSTSGFAALHFAARYDQLTAVKTIVELGKADVNAQTRGCVKYAIAFAAALGHVAVVEYLFDKTSPHGKTCAIHAAVAKAQDEVVRLLLSKDISLRNAKDRKGHTPLAIAVKANFVSTTNILLYGPTQTNQKNATDQQPIQDEENIGQQRPISASKAVGKSMKSQQVGRRQSVYAVRKDKGAKYFHAAVSQGKVHTITDLIEEGFDPNTLDEYDNTFLHVAAAENNANILGSFMFKFEHLTQKKNSFDETPLHIAIIRGHLDAVRVLVKHAPSLGINYKGNCTPLHLAVKFHQEKIVTEIVKAIRACGWLSLLDRQDDRGRTALHYAITYYKGSELRNLQTLSWLKPGPIESGSSKALGEMSNSALHLAAAMPSTDVLSHVLETFYSSDDRRNSIDEPDVSGRTALMVCVENANIDGASLLLERGAKIDARDSKDLTVLHRMVLLTVDNPSKANHMVELYQSLISNRVLSRDNIKTAYNVHNKRTTSNKDDFLHLTSVFESCLADEDTAESCNMCEAGDDGDIRKHLLTHIYASVKRYADTCPRGMTVMQLAAAAGASEMLREFLNNARLEGFYLKYKPTNVIPKALYTNDEYVPEVSEGMSCLELIAYEGHRHAVKMSEIEPLKTFLKTFSRIRSFFFGVLVLSHVLHMAFFSAAVLRSCQFYSAAFRTECTQSKVWVYLVWPAMIVLYLGLRLCIFVHGRVEEKWRRARFKLIATGATEGTRVVTQYRIFKSVTYLSSIVFCILTLGWFLSVGRVNETTYGRFTDLASVVIIAGWLHTLEYLKGIEYFSGFSKYLKIVLLKNILLFGCVYAFILIGFALAIQIYVQIDDDYYMTHNSSFLSTVFDTFGMTIGASQVFTSDEDRFRNLQDGHNPMSAKVLFAVYLCLSTIMLLNLLIAMMNKSYQEIDGEINLLWIYENIRLAVFLAETRIQLIQKPTRWFMKRFIFKENGQSVEVYLDESTLTRVLLGHDYSS
jgi:ankyrin repeat protein